MARVPAYQQQVAPTVTPFVQRSDNNASAEDFGGGVARVASQFAGVAQQIAQREQEKADTAAQMEVENGLAALETRTLDDPDHGLLYRKGKDAIGLGQQFTPAWEKGSAEVVGNAPRHLQAWAQQQAMRRQQDATRRLMVHSAQEADKYYTGQAQALMQSATDAATVNYADPARVQEEAARAMVAADRLADLQGADEISRKQARMAAASQVQRAALERQLGDDPIAADARFQTVKAQLSGSDAAAIEDKLRPLVRANEFEAIAQTALSGRAPSANVVPPQRGKPTPQLRSAIEASAAKYGVPVEYLLALCEQESSFNPRAVNKETGAAGLFQYIPTTAQDRGIDPMDVQAACDAAAKDFAERMKAGGVDEAIASHFAGPGGGNRGDKTAAYVADVKGRAMRWAGQHQQPTPQAPPATLGEALDTLKADPRYDNPVWRRGAESAIERAWSIKERDEADRDNAALDAMRSKVDAAPIGAPLASTLGGDYGTAVTKGWLPSLKAIADAKAEGRLIQTDPVLFDKFARLQATNPAEFAKPQTMREIGAAAGKLATSDYARLRSAWDAMQKPGSEGKQADWATAQERLDSGYRLLGIAPVRGKPADHEVERGQFRLFYQQAEQAFIQSTGKKPSPEQADVLLRDAVRRVSLNPSLLKGAQAAETLAAGLEASGAHGNVRLTREDRATVAAVLKQRGVTNPTEAQIVAAAASYYASP